MAGKGFICSDESVNSYGSRVITKGIDLKDFKKNPVMLFNHVNYGSNYKGPIGHWTDIKIEDGKLIATPVFDDQDEFALSIKSKYENGHLRGASIGFRPIEASDDPKLMLQGQKYATITKAKLIEISIVDIPANKNALALYDEAGNIIEMTDENITMTLSAINNKTNTEMNLKNIIQNFIKQAKSEGIELKDETPEAETPAVEQTPEPPAEVTQLNEKITALSAEVETLKAANEQITPLQNQVTQLQEENNALKAENESAAKTIQQYTDHLKKMRTPVDIPPPATPTATPAELSDAPAKSKTQAKEDLKNFGRKEK